jgi:hypothetical protein
MLILNRQPGQAFSIAPQPNLSPVTTVAELFAPGPIRVRMLRIRGDRVRFGIEAHAGLCIVREELEAAAAPKSVAGDARLALGIKLRILMVQRGLTTQALAQAAGLPWDRVVAAECGAGAADLDDLDKIARALRIKVVELFRPAGRTAEERALLEILEGQK